MSHQGRHALVPWLPAALLLLVCATEVLAVDQEVKWEVDGSGSSALRDYVSDGVGNATQDSNLGGLYLPFYTEGTGVGQQKFINSSVDYTIGDYALSSALYNSSGRPVVQFPTALGAVTIYYNISNFTTSPNSLRLNASVAAAIFQGNITTWDHPDILAINPNLTKLTPSIQGKNITVIVRNESVAAAQAFSYWLNASSNGTWVLGVNNTIKWPKLSNFIYTIGGSNLTGLVANHTYSIAFSDAYAGKRAKLYDAQLRNKNGTWLKYSNANWTFTDLGGDEIKWPSSPDQDWSKFNIVNLNGNRTWPLPTAAFAATNIDLRDKEERGGAQKQMFGYLLGPSVAKFAPAYQEYPLPPAFLNYSIWATKLIKTKSSLVFYEPNQLPSLSAPYNTKFTTS